MSPGSVWLRRGAWGQKSSNENRETAFPSQRVKGIPNNTVAIGLMSAVLFLFFAMSGFGWTGSSANISMHPFSPNSENSERKTSRSLQQGPGQRSCRGPLPQEEAELPTLVSLQKWASGKQRPRESISLVTHLSIDRLPSLENQCITWPDHLAAIIYLPMIGNSSGGPPYLPQFSNTGLDDIVTGIDSLHNFMEATAACSFHIELVGQILLPGYFPGAYPVNALRNRALMLSPTDLAIPVDVDFVVTPMLGLPGAGYRDRAVFAQMETMAAQRQVLVLPSLELTNKWQDLALAGSVARDVVLAGKQMAKGALERNVMSPYRSPDTPHFYDVSNTTRWAAIETPTLYEVPIHPLSEPCVLVSLATVPWYDERFVDFGGSATTWFVDLAVANFSFLVHPYGFVVHVPHGAPPQLSPYMEAQRKLRIGRMELLRQRIVEELEVGTYAPVLRMCDEVDEGEEEEEKVEEEVRKEGDGGGAADIEEAAATDTEDGTSDDDKDDNAAAVEKEEESSVKKSKKDGISISEKDDDDDDDDDES